MEFGNGYYCSLAFLGEVCSGCKTVGVECLVYDWAQIWCIFGYGFELYIRFGHDFGEGLNDNQAMMKKSRHIKYDIYYLYNGLLDYANIYTYIVVKINNMIYIRMYAI